ncbi:MAG: hypothetical protein Q9209_001952 [Squamulea sp. 1 TL-2023]
MVGPENHRFLLHKALLCRFSFFKAAFEGDFQESEGTIKLSQHDPAIFRFLIYWLYTGRIDGHYYPSTATPSMWQIELELLRRREIKGRSTNGDDEDAYWDQQKLRQHARYMDAPFHALVGLYLLAEYLLIPGLKDQIVNTMIEVYGYRGETEDNDFWAWEDKDRPAWAKDPIEVINTAWKSSSKTSNLCRLLVSLFCDNMANVLEDTQELEKLNHEFLCAAFLKAQSRWLEGTGKETEGFPFDDTVTVLVGPNNERFSIHKRLICKYPFFQAAFDGKFKESTAGTLKLPEHDPAIFRFFTYWLYTGKLDGHHYPSTAKPSIADIRRESNMEWQDLHGKHLPHYTAQASTLFTYEKGQLYRLLTYRDAPFDSLIGLYLLAEYLGVPGLGNEIINILVDVYANSKSNMEGVLTSFWRWQHGKLSRKTPIFAELLVVLFCDNVVSNAEDIQENELLNARFLSAAFTMAQERWLCGSSRTQWQNADALCPYHKHDGTTCRVHNEKLAKAKK